MIFSATLILSIIFDCDQKQPLEVFVESVHKEFRKIHRKTHMSWSFLIKLQAKPAAFLKKSFCHRCFTGVCYYLDKTFPGNCFCMICCKLNISKKSNFIIVYHTYLKFNLFWTTGQQKLNKPITTSGNDNCYIILHVNQVNYSNFIVRIVVWCRFTSNESLVLNFLQKQSPRSVL